MQEPFGAWSVDAAHAFLVPGAKLSTEKAGVEEIRTRDLFVTLTLDTMSKDQLNQKLKLMVEAPGIDLYSIKNYPWNSKFPTIILIKLFVESIFR